MQDGGEERGGSNMYMYIYKERWTFAITACAAMEMAMIEMSL